MVKFPSKQFNLLSGLFKRRLEKKQPEIHEQESLEELRYIFDNLNVGIWIKDYNSWNISYISKGAGDILQIPLDQFLHPKMWEKMIHPEDLESVLEKRKLLENGETVIQQYRVNCGDGTIKWLYGQTLPWFDEKGKLTHFFGIFADITNEVQMREQLEYIATHDQLTDLPNQRSLYKKIETLINSKQVDEFALLYLDLDRFGLINDSLGHHIGDLVLKETANRLLSISLNDGYIASLTNNDFIVIVENFASKKDVSQLAKELIKVIAEPITVEDYDLHITTSIGISLFPDDGVNKVKLISSAHTALYHAKQIGINSFEFHSFSKDITSYRKFILEQDMRKAIDNEEFELYYQPIVEPNTGVILSAEALIRWNHEEWGLVSPAEFIPLAEENLLINEISDWVIKQVCSELRAWIDGGYTIRPISINISPIRFMKKGLVELIEQQLAFHNIQAKYIVFEITESSLLRNQKSVLTTIARLKKLGIRIAIDDFGTGFASLQTLREFPADKIKIDLVFIQNIQADSKQDKAIISSIIHLAKGLDMKVIAEGVEEYEQLNFLKQNECDQVQGYLFSRPVPIDTYSQMLTTGYLRPSKPHLLQVPDQEHRNFFRLQFPNHVIGEVSIIEVNERKVNLGSAQILIENISLGGLKVLSSLDLPVNSTIKFNFFMEFMGEQFQLEGGLVWKNEAKRNAFYYGVQFIMSDTEQDRLSHVINKMTVLQNLNREIPDTPFIHENPYAFLNKIHL